MWQIFLKYNFQSSYRIETWALAVKFLSGEPHHWEINMGYIIIWSHYLSQCWPICMPPYCVTRPQCVEMSKVVEIHPQGNQPFFWLVAVDGSRPLPGGAFQKHLWAHMRFWNAPLNQCWLLKFSLMDPASCTCEQFHRKCRRYRFVNWV